MDRRSEHFEWRSDCEIMVGKTTRGRATVATLGLNGPRYRAQRRRLRKAMRVGEPAWP
jgi:hypothetical protein